MIGFDILCCNLVSGIDSDYYFTIFDRNSSPKFRSAVEALKQTRGNRFRTDCVTKPTVLSDPSSLESRVHINEKPETIKVKRIHPYPKS